MYSDVTIFDSILDANLFHNLETWAPDPLHESTTQYLNLIQTFQRYLSTEAFKIAGGLDLVPSATKPTRQHRISSNFTMKITKSFLDSLYAFLDGLVLLASDESEYKRPPGGALGNDVISGGAGSRAELIDLTNPVRLFIYTIHPFTPTHRKLPCYRKLDSLLSFQTLDT